jgi:hypothetical protein
MASIVIGSGNVSPILQATLSNPPEEGSGDPMRIPPMGYLTLALLCGELVCVIVWAFTGIFLVLVAGIAAGVGCVLAAMRWKD